MTDSPKTRMQATSVRITDACRARHGDDAALEEALRRVREAYADCCSAWTLGKGATFELVLMLERPDNVHRRDVKA